MSSTGAACSSRWRSSSCVLSAALAVAHGRRRPEQDRAGRWSCFAIGVGQAIHGPTYSAALPALVDREDLAGAISLNSAQMNASRVIGPAIGGVLYAAVGVSWVFVVNTATYLIVIGVLLVIRLPAVDKDPDEPKGLRRLLGGFVVARQDRTIRRVLLTMATFSLLCLPFITQMAVVAERNLGIDGRSAAFGLFYACFGVGAVIGALSIGTVFAGHSKRRLVRQGLGLFAVVRRGARRSSASPCSPTR